MSDGDYIKRSVIRRLGFALGSIIDAPIGSLLSLGLLDGLSCAAFAHDLKLKYSY